MESGHVLFYRWFNHVIIPPARKIHWSGMSLNAKQRGWIIEFRTVLISNCLNCWMFCICTPNSPENPLVRHLARPIFQGFVYMNEAIGWLSTQHGCHRPMEYGVHSVLQNLCLLVISTQRIGSLTICLKSLSVPYFCKRGGGAECIIGTVSSISFRSSGPEWIVAHFPCCIGIAHFTARLLRNVFEIDCKRRRTDVNAQCSP